MRIKLLFAQDSTCFYGDTCNPEPFHQPRTENSLTGEKLLAKSWQGVAPMQGAAPPFHGGLALSQKGTATWPSCCTTPHASKGERLPSRIKRSMLTEAALPPPRVTEAACEPNILLGQAFHTAAVLHRRNSCLGTRLLTEQIVSFAVPAASPSGIKASLMRTPGALRGGLPAWASEWACWGPRSPPPNLLS